MWSYDPLCDTWRWTAPPRKPRVPKRTVFRTWRCNYPAYDDTTSQARLRELAAFTHWTNVVWRAGTDHILYVTRDHWGHLDSGWLRRWEAQIKKNPGGEAGAEGRKAGPDWRIRR